MASRNLIRFILARPPKGERGWNGRIMRSGRVKFDGTWQTKAGAEKGWRNLIDGFKRGQYIAEPVITDTQRAKPLKQRKRK